MSLLDTVLPAVTALAGVGLGHTLNWRRETRAWQRDKKYEVYNAVTSAARILLWRGDEIDANRSDASLEERRERVRQAMFELREQLTSVSLITDGKPATVASELENHCGNVLYDYFFTVQQADDQAEDVLEARRLLTKFADAARKELKGV